MKLMLWLAALVGAAALSAAPVAAQGPNGTIGVYSDLTATQSSGSFSIGVPRTIYIVATLNGQTADGITGAEFRVDGMPDDWLVFVTANPAAGVVLGDPFRVSGGARRANIAFVNCAPGAGGHLLLYTAVVIPQSFVTPRDLTVQGGNPPSNPNFAAPLFTRCDSPAYSKVAAFGASFQLDVRAPQDLDYSELPGYDGVRGVQPHQGVPGDMFHFRALYTSADGLLPAAGSPRLELDGNGDGDALDPGEGTFTLMSADQDSTLNNGKEYRYDVALGAPPSGRYHYRFTATDAHGAVVPGVATAWHDSLFVSDEFANLVVHGEDIRILPINPSANDLAGIVARIENRSDRQVNGVTVRIENVFGQTIIERVLSTMGPRSFTEVASSWHFADPGFQPVRVRVDAGNTILESDETDNVATHAVFVGGSGIMAIGGLPPIVTTPPVGPFALNGNAVYTVGALPPSVVSGARVVCSPSWEASQTTYTNAAGEFHAAFTPPAVPGTYRLSFVVRDGARADSSIVSVQVSPFAGQQAPHLANLVLHLGAALGAGCPATTAAISWSVENRGDRASLPTTVRLLSDGVTVASQIALGAVAPGATVVLDPVEVPVSGPGLRSFTAHVDPSNALREFRKDDNAAAASVAVPPGCLDLALDQARFTSSPFCSSVAVPFTVRVVNRGCQASAPARVACRVGDTEIASGALGALAPGATAEVAFSHLFDVSCQELEFGLDPEGAAGTDCDTRSNDLTASLCVENCGVLPSPNFRVEPCDLQVTNSHPAPGEQVHFQAWISNVGPGNASLPVGVRFEVDGLVIGGAVPIGPLHAGDRMLATASGTWPANFAPHVLTVTVDPQGQTEASDSDNIAARPLPWNLHPQAIARCPAATAMFSSCGPCPGAPIDIRAVVVNDGLFDCDSVEVDFRDDLQGGALLGTAVAHDVRGGNACAAAVAPVHITHGFPAGLYRVAAVVDPHNAWSETDETDNTYAQDLQVGCALTIDLVSAIHFPPGFAPQPGDTVRSVDVQVTNLGTGTAFSVEARLKLDQVTLCDLQMGTIEPGGSSTVKCTTPWVVSAPACSQQLEACADPNGHIGETDETNNCATTGAGVGGPGNVGITPYDIRISPTNPSAGQSVVIDVDVYNHNPVETSCLLKVEWLAAGIGPLPVGTVPLRLPPGPIYVRSAARLIWVTPFANLVLHFQLSNVCPEDENLEDNDVLGSLPWFIPPQTPVTVSDLGAESMPDGVLLHWRAEPSVESFALERRRTGESAWIRLPDAVPALSAANAARYEVLDATAEPGAHLEYRIIGRFAGGREEAVGLLSWTYDRAGLFALQLHPVHPNPFRPGGAFEFSLPASGSVDLCVFDTAGRRVAALRHGPEPAGRHTVAWDGCDATGRRVPAGVYFCRFVAGSFQQTRRVVLMR